MKKLTTKIHEEIIKNTGVVPFIAIDQEGGLVTRMMKDVTFAPGPMTASASIENATYYTGKMLAEDMIRLGMNLNLAPSLDVNNNPNNPVINVRSYSDNPEYFYSTVLWIILYWKTQYLKRILTPLKEEFAY